MTERRKRANGIASRAAILDAAAQVAGERGYEGTSIKLVSERSGLPASSIYWHFRNKDELIAAVIDRSFKEWIDAITAVPAIPEGGTDPVDLFVSGLQHAGAQLARFPDFLRLGLMLMLERRPDEPSARQRFRDARSETLDQIERLYTAMFTTLGPDRLRRLATFTLAASDGLFIAADAGPENIDLTEEFGLLAHAVLGAARSLGWSEDRVGAARSR